MDLHMHTTVSDGTDTPAEILSCVREQGLSLFSVTDHDAIKGTGIIRKILKEGDPGFLPGVEFSCKDEQGKYHILGYGYDPEAESMQKIVALGHSYRMKKLNARLQFLEQEYGFSFSEQDRSKLYAMDNPGKPHIANLMVACGYVKTKEEAIQQYINNIHFGKEYVRPEEAVTSILAGGGIPVLAHPAYGSGDQLIIGAEMEERLKRLIGFGLKGMEAFYSGFTKKLRMEMLFFAEKYGLYVTAGSDYHGTNKLVRLGDTGITEAAEIPEGMHRFLEKVEQTVVS